MLVSGTLSFPTMFSKDFLSRIINPLPNGKILDQSKFKYCTDYKIYVAQKLKFVIGWVENIVSLKVEIVW